ncbi:MAG: hypothetical protein WA970_16575 [Gammaproteobacteria bacterium]
MMNEPSAEELPNSGVAVPDLVSATAGDPGSKTRNVVNVTARLASLASSGEILIGASAWAEAAIGTTPSSRADFTSKARTSRSTSSF